MLGAILSSVCRLTVPPYVFDLSGLDGGTFVDNGTLGVEPSAGVFVDSGSSGLINITHTIRTDLDATGGSISGADPADPLLQVQFIQNSGSNAGLSGGANFGEWHSVSEGIYVAQATTAGTFFDSITISYRYAGGPVLATATFTLAVSLDI